MKVIPLEKRQRRTDDRGVDSVLEIFDIRTNERKALKTYQGVIEAPNWSRDGKRLIFNSRGLLVSYDLCGGDETVVNTGYANACNNDHVLSFDGMSVAVSHQTWEDGQSRVYTMPLSDGSPQSITPQSISPRLITALAPSYLHGWSPDGNRLAYCAERNGQYDIYTIPALGGRETRLTDTPGLDDGPEYSPCGRYIWFNSTRSGLMQVWRMNADGSDPVQMTTDDASNSWFPHVSPDGNWVVYIAYAKDDVEPHAHPPNKNVELRMMPVQGGAYKPLLQLFGGQGTINVNSWSPDSAQFAFVSYKKV